MLTTGGNTMSLPGGRSGRPLRIAVCMTALFLVSCAAPARMYLVEEPDPFYMELSEGTAWVYWLIDQDDPGLQPVAQDTLITWIEKELRRPGSTILIDPLVNLSRHSSYREFRDDPQALEQHLRQEPVRLPFDSFHLPAMAWFDSTRFIEHQLVRVAGPVCQIEARGDSSLGK